MCIEIYDLDPAKLLSAPGLAWQVVLKKKQIAKANSKYMKDYDENKKLSQIQYWNVNNLYG